MHFTKIMLTGMRKVDYVDQDWTKPQRLVRRVLQYSGALEVRVKEEGLIYKTFRCKN